MHKVLAILGLSVALGAQAPPAASIVPATPAAQAAQSAQSATGALGPQATPPKPPPSTDPGLAVEEPPMNLGDIPGNGLRKFVIHLVNQGKTDVTIRQVRATCGCTMVQPQVGVMAPGARLELPISFNPKGFTGPIHKMITVESNDAAHPKIEWTFEGTVKRAYFFQPRMILLDAQMPDAKASGDFRFIPMEHLDPVATVALKDDAGRDLPLALTWEIKNGEVQGSVSFATSKLAPEALDKLLGTTQTCHVVLTTKTGATEEGEVVWTLKRPILITPMRMALFYSKGQGGTHRHTVNLDGSLPFQVLKAVGSRPEIVVVATRKGPKTFEIAATVGDLPPGTYSETVTVTTDHKGCKTLGIPMSLIINP